MWTVFSSCVRLCQGPGMPVSQAGAPPPQRLGSWETVANKLVSIKRGSSVTAEQIQSEEERACGQQETHRPGSAFWRRRYRQAREEFGQKSPARRDTGKHSSSWRNWKKLFQWSPECVGDRTRKGGKDEAGEPSGAHVTKGPVSRCKKSLC